MTIQELTSTEALVAKLTEANQAYRRGEEIMTDAEYDALEDQLRMIQPDHPFLRQVNDAEQYGREEPLTIPMGSQQKALTLPEMDPFYRATGEDEYFWSLKLDGMSAELTYEQDVLTKGLTRGDGKIGCNITEIVRSIPSVPRSLPATGHKRAIIRGEILMHEDKLEELNRRLVADGREPYRNTRNGTVGLVNTLKNLKYVDVLTFKAFNVIFLDD